MKLNRLVAGDEFFVYRQYNFMPESFRFAVWKVMEANPTLDLYYIRARGRHDDVPVLGCMEVRLLDWGRNLT